MRQIQKKSLPSDWLTQVEQYDIDKSSLSENTKLLASKLIMYIKSEKEESLTSYFVQPLVKHIIFESAFSISYDDVPEQLFLECIEETNGEKGFNFTRKFHSIFIELQTYQKLINHGFRIDDFNRSEGSCDLVMRKNGQVYNFEVKFKESIDISHSRFFDYIDGMSLLKENTFLRGKIFEIYLKVDAPSYEGQLNILKEIEQFIENKNEIFEGQYLNIFPANKRREISRDIKYISEHLDSLRISSELTDSKNIEALIQKLFIDNNGHITKLSTKSQKFDNFNGCLVWSIPFHKEIDTSSIEEAFNKLGLDFDLYVFLSGIGQDEFNFIVEGKSTTNQRRPIKKPPAGF